ncbi:energy-coupling factor ABC transporter permease [Marinomonas balearica]|uniref:Cobalt uptake protein with substrate-specific transmembrane region n=1 Tax=Marinomonas balearica TaxID=491947 RepID=A0A4R6M6Y1_9GAMM|nr:energy-coupling factor ABC transporter permease [Marinomonas balearica]TDO96350.1 cobalt uptake protein with substrate-specific transmembrane region [Marinomonas balearica]
MHIEPGLVNEAKIILSYATAVGALAYLGKDTWDAVKERGLMSVAARSMLSVLLVFCFFEILPHQAVGVSEVHFILGSTLFLILGSAPAAIGLAGGLLVQGMFFAQIDLPQYGMNVTTLLVPLFVMGVIANKVIGRGTAYIEIKYTQALRLSLTYQGGIVAWVAFWAFYGQGFGAENVSSVASFSVAYLSVVLIEPVFDVAILGVAKLAANFKHSALLETRLFNA